MLLSTFSAGNLSKAADEVTKPSNLFTDGEGPKRRPKEKPAVEETQDEVVATTEEVVEPATQEEPVQEQEQEEVQEPVQEQEEEPVQEEAQEEVQEQEGVQEPVKEEEPVVEEPKQEAPSPQFEEASFITEPNLSDSNAFQRLSSSSAVAAPGNESYAELVENMVATQCQLSGVKNLDLTTFGIRAQVLNFPNLSVLTYGRHKFLGAPFTEEEENMIIHRLGLHVAQSPKEKIVVRAVQEIRGNGGMSYYSLLFTDSIAQKFANMFNYVVHANLNESDISKLVLVIQK